MVRTSALTTFLVFLPAEAMSWRKPTAAPANTVPPEDSNSADFEAHGSVHHNSILIKIQLDATVWGYLFAAKSLYTWSRWREVAVPVLWPVAEAAVTVFSTPIDGCCDIWSM